MSHGFSSGAAGYRGRLAPSPTGYLHIGHARTFWTAFERARDAGGVLAMRMEDLDPQRSRSIFATAAYEDLRWLGMDWQEGPDAGGPLGPYEQSRRGEFYRAAWKRLYASGCIYPCRCSRKDLEAALAAPHEGATVLQPEDDEPIYPGTCRKYLDPEARASDFTARAFESPEGLNWRFAVPDGEAVEFFDENLGPQRYAAGRDFGDFLVWRRDGMPSYQLACVADDAAMQISEVVRGADLLKSTARQILLNRALGYENPKWFHCRLVLDENGQRLAKRNDALSLRELRRRGLSPEQVRSGRI